VRVEQQQEITNRLNAELADDPVRCSGFSSGSGCLSL